MKKDFPLIRKEYIFSGKAIRLEKLWLKAPNRRTIMRELIRHGGAAVVIPVLKGEKFVLVYQHRVATDGWLLEFPAGTLEPNEKPRVCASRELIEETGFRAGKLVKMVDFYPAPGISTERMYLYLGMDLKPAPAKLDSDEFLRVTILSYRELQKKIERGVIKDGKTIIGFFYYQVLKRLGRIRA